MNLIDVSALEGFLCLERGMFMSKHCINCNKSYGDDSRFCPACGGELKAEYQTVKQNPVDTNIAGTASVRYWKMISDLVFIISRNTRISAEGKLLNIDQYHSCGIKWARQTINIDISDITSIEYTKRISQGSVGLLVFVTISLIEKSDSILLWIFFVAILLKLKERLIIIKYSGGTVKIGANSRDTADSFIEYVKQYNPDAIKNVIE